MLFGIWMALRSSLWTCFCNLLFMQTIPVIFQTIDNSIYHEGTKHAEVDRNLQESPLHSIKLLFHMYPQITDCWPSHWLETAISYKQIVVLRLSNINLRGSTSEKNMAMQSTIQKGWRHSQGKPNPINCEPKIPQSSINRKIQSNNEKSRYSLSVDCKNSP